jgi:hypothetical protein
MSRQAPSYRLHKPSGQAVVTLNGKDCYLGAWNSDDSRNEYDRLIAEWLTHGRQLPPTKCSDKLISIAELVAAYSEHSESYYRHPDGSPTSEFSNIRLALRPLRKLYGHTPAANFDCVALETVRAFMIEMGRCRNRINKDVARVKRLFRWGATKKLVPAAVFHELGTIEGLRAGRSAARETSPIRPVDDAVVAATLPLASSKCRLSG